MYNKTLNISDTDIQKCEDVETLRAWMRVIEEDIVKMSNSLGKARAHFFETGEYADPTWYNNTESAKRIQGAMKSHIQSRLSALKSKLPKSDLPNVFMDVARQRLSEDAFNSIFKEAKMIYEGI